MDKACPYVYVSLVDRLHIMYINVFVGEVVVVAFWKQMTSIVNARTKML